jgi:sugar phosphate isomerase/epimerase
MKACFSTLGCPDWNIDQILACVKDLGFEGIEIRGLGGEMFAPKSPHLQPGSRFLQELESLGCAVAGLGSSASFGKPAEALAECRAYVDAAAAIGCKLVRVFGGRLPEGMDHAEGAKALAPALREACQYAQEKGVIIGIETHDDWCRGDELALVLEAVDHPALQVIWDMHHSYRHGESPAQTQAALGNRVVHVHLKDGFEREGKVDYRLFGEGDLPLVEMLQTLKDAGYEGFLSLEWEKKWHPEIADPEVAFPQFRSKLAELLSQLA